MYWVGAWNACTLVGLMIGAVEGLVGSGKAGREVSGESVDVQDEEQERGRKSRAVRFTGSDEGSGEQSGEGARSGVDEAHSGSNVWEGIEHNDRASTTSHHDDEGAEEATERTPLMSHRVVMRKSALKSSDVVLDETVQDRALFWWIMECLFEVPIPITLLGNILVLWVGAMSQTVLDGGWAGIGEFAISLLSRHIASQVFLNVPVLIPRFCF